MSEAWGKDGGRSPKSRKQIEVLVVQSNPADTLLTVEAFRAAGVSSGLRCVNEGKDALSYVNRTGKYCNVPVPDLVFFGLIAAANFSPGCIEGIKSTPELMHIPIVVAAGSDDPKFVRTVYELNGNCFIKKPGGMSEFLQCIETCYEFWTTVVTLSRNARRLGRRFASAQEA